MSPEAVIAEPQVDKRRPDPAKQARLLDALYAAQERHGYLRREALEEVAEQLGLSLSHVYDTASFYSLFHTQPVGRYVIQVCEGLSCYLRDGAERVVDHIAAKLGIRPGESTPDGRFTLVTVQCLGSCDSSPVMRVNDELYEHLTPDRIDRILRRLREEEG